MAKVKKIRNFNLKEYQAFCRKTAKKIKDKDKEIFIWGLGVAGEAGDVASCIKKTYAHKDNQKAGIRENIGDTLWYIAMICNFFNWDLQDILKENIEKLEKRYPKGFTNKKSKRDGKRIDWNER